MKTLNEPQAIPRIKPYLTKSVEEIAFLRHLGFRLIREPFGDGRYKWATFEDSSGLREAIQKFYNGSSEKRLFDELRNAKQYLMD